MPRLTPEQRARAVGRLEAGDDAQVVAVAFNCHVSTIYRLQQRFQTTGSTADAPRRGRPRVTTARQDRFIFRNHLGERFETAEETARTLVGNHQHPISGQTVRRRLVENHLYNRRPALGPVLTRRHRHARLQWAQARVNWTWRQWQHVLFTDESRYCLSRADGRIRVWRRRGERYSDACVLENNRWGGSSVMIWGGITLNQRIGPIFFRGLGPGHGNGVTAQRYIDQVLRPHLLPFSQGRRNFTLQHDNARPHTARITANFLQQHNIQVMPWPALSPDLNPIEHLWDRVQRELNRVLPRPTTAAELERALLRAWNNIPMAAVNTLIHSMRRRCQDVINARGGHTPY